MSARRAKKGDLSWIKLTLLGMGFTTGTGFFLGSSLAIEMSGYSVLLAFVLAAIGTYFVFSALANMIAQQAEQGSFRTYSKKAFGRWAGFSHGWMYWFAEILILGSQLTAIGLFTRFWFDNIPLWIFSASYAILGIAIVLLGTKGFEKAENIFAVIKMSAIIMFIIMAVLVITGVLGRKNAHVHEPTNFGDFFTDGFMGLWASLIYVFFAFAGIEVMGIMAANLKNPKEAPKAGKAMLFTITALYLISIAIAMLLTPLDNITANESPFVTALKDLHYTVLVHIFNGVLITAGFSSLVASLFSVTQMMYTIAKDGDAPKILSKRTKKRKLPYSSLILTLIGMTLSVIAALVLPKKVYEYITTAGGLMLIYTWLFILFASHKIIKSSGWQTTKLIVAVILILAATTGTIFDKTSRPGLYVSLGLVLMIAIITFFMRKRWAKE